MSEKRRYAAKLVFFMPNSIEGNYFYEIRIVLTEAETAAEALAFFKKRGEEENRETLQEDGTVNRCAFEGILEMLCIDPELDSDEVWYDIVERKRPKGLKIPPENELNAVYWEAQRLKEI